MQGHCGGGSIWAVEIREMRHGGDLRPWNTKSHEVIGQGI